MQNFKSQKIAEAIAFAFAAHEGQTRKGSSEPYIMHPLRVFSMLVELRIDDNDILCASILHDTIEDCDVTADDINRKFGESVCNLVLSVTDDTTLPRVERKTKSRKKLASASTKAKLIKAVDRYDNLSNDFPSFWTNEKKLQYLKESKLLIEALTKSLYDDIYCIFVRQFADSIEAKIIEIEQKIQFERNKVNGDS